MQWKYQQLGLMVVVAVILVYVGYRAWMAGGLENLAGEFQGAGPSPSTTATPATSPTSPTATSAGTGLPPASAAPQAPPTGAAAAVLFRINERRAGSVVLASNPILVREAQEHASDMARRGYFDHTNPDGITFQQRMTASGYPAVAVAENLGLTSGDDTTAVVGLWMESQGHRDNMLNPDYRAVGIGVARGMWQGQQATFVVAIFGAER